MHPCDETDRRLQRVFDLVEECISGPCTVETMAREACFSLFHFIRVFTRASLYSPYEYLIRRRVSSAMERVFREEFRITDAAFEYGFDSVEGFSRAVKRCCGRAPSQLTSEILAYLPSPWSVPRLEIYRRVCQGSEICAPVDRGVGRWWGDGSGEDGTGENSAEEYGIPGPASRQIRAIAFEYLGQQGFGCLLSLREAEEVVSRAIGSILPTRTGRAISPAAAHRDSQTLFKALLTHEACARRTEEMI